MLAEATLAADGMRARVPIILATVAAGDWALYDDPFHLTGWLAGPYARDAYGRFRAMTGVSRLLGGFTDAANVAAAFLNLGANPGDPQGWHMLA